MKKRAMLINTVVGKGSVGRIVTGLASALEKRGYETLIAYGRWDAPEGFRSVRIDSTPEILIHGFLSRITDKHGLFSDRATERLIKTIREFDPEIIHLHNLHGYYVNYRILFSFLKNEFVGKGGRVVWTLHDCWSFTGHCVHFEYAGCDRWKSGCHNCPEKRQYPASFLMDSSESNYNNRRDSFAGIPGLTLVTPSEWLRDRVGESFLKEYPVDVIPTGIDLKVFRPEESSLRDRYGVGGKTLLLGVANPWRERKGFDDFIKLSEAVDEDTVIVMIGLKPEQIKRLKSCKNIIPLKKTDSLKEMVQWYTAADIYVNLTLEDTFPTTNLEALSCGTPVITYRAGGSPEALDEKTGRVVEKGDISAVMLAVKDILSSDREELKRSCIEKAAEYSADRRFTQYLDEVYEKDLC